MANDDRSYNGWANYETWAVNLWLESEKGSYREMRELADQSWSDASGDSTEDRKKVATYDLFVKLKNWLGDMNPLAGDASLWSDLLSTAFSEVDFYEIARHLIDEVVNDD